MTGDPLPRPRVACTACGMVLPEGLFNSPDQVRCPGCGVLLRVDAFPALHRAAEPRAPGERILAQGEASCFYHAERKAELYCAACGRFLCALCDLPVGGRHLCPPCLEEERDKGTAQDLVRHRTLYDSTALTIAIVSTLAVFPSMFTAPVVLYLVFKYWKAPSSLLPRTKVRLVAAALLAVLQLAAWTWLTGYLVLKLVESS